MKVELTYFKPNGKWYADGEYETTIEVLYRIWEEVEAKLNSKTLPGLMEGHSPFVVLVDVPEHSHRHPHLVGMP